MDIYKEIVNAGDSSQPLVLATVIEAIGSAPRHEGTKMLIKPDGIIIGTIGGGAIEKAILEEAQQLFKNPGTKFLHYDLVEDLSMACGGKMSLFLEVINPPQSLFIFGAGHIGSILTKIGKLLSFRVTVIDNRLEFANENILPQADKIIQMDYTKALKNISFTADSYIVIVTHRHIHDQEILEYCVQQPHKYIGMISSKSKASKALARLREIGIKEKKIQAIHAPIGLNIGADTPGEIAVAIAAELIAIRSGQLAGEGRTKNPF